MKSLARTAFAIPALILAASGSTLTDAEKQEALAQLDRTRTGLIEATSGLSPAQWNFKPAPDRWSAAEVLEHVVMVEERLLEFTSQKVMQAPAGKPDRDYKAADRLVVKAIADRTEKAKAPEFLLPTGRRSAGESLEAFQKARARTVDFLKTTPGLRDHVMNSPLGQPLDAYQWLLYISAHSERHTKQILELKADTNFPRN